MDNNPKKLSDAAAMAQFRLALIAPVIHGLYPDASRNAYYQRGTEKPLTLPDGDLFQYSPKTLSKWVSLYQNGGIDALMPQERSDKGSTRVLPDTAIEEIYRLKEAFPRLNSTQFHRHLVEEAFIPATVSVCFLKDAPVIPFLAKFTEDREQKYSQLETVHLSKGQKLNRLKELSKMYALFAPIQATYKECQSLKGFAKMKYDKEHKDSLSKYPELKERMQSLLQNGEKITPKQWKAEIQSLQSEYDSIGREQTKTATELAYAEVIGYNRKNFERELQNESRQHNRQQSRPKRSKEEEI